MLKPLQPACRAPRLLPEPVNDLKIINWMHVKWSKEDRIYDLCCLNCNKLYEFTSQICFNEVQHCPSVLLQLGGCHLLLCYGDNSNTFTYCWQTRRCQKVKKNQKQKSMSYLIYMVRNARQNYHHLKAYFTFTIIFVKYLMCCTIKTCTYLHCVAAWWPQNTSSWRSEHPGRSGLAHCLSYV